MRNLASLVTWVPSHLQYGFEMRKIQVETQILLVPQLKIFTRATVFSIEVVSRDVVLKTLESRKSVAVGEHSGPLYRRFGFPDAPDDDASWIFQDHRITKPMLSDAAHFQTNFAQIEAEAMQDYEAYFMKFGRGNCMILAQHIQQLFRKSPVPFKIRAFVWLRISGASLRRLSSPVDLFLSLIARAKTEAANAPHRDQIELDLHRSMPEHPYFQEDAGINALRDALLAYSVFNPTVGYCQSMNIVASALLLVCTPEETFFLLAAIIERIPEYYIGQMLGSIVDLKIFSNLVSKHRPALFQHVSQRCGTDISLIALPWFLCFFVGYIPWEACYRLLDVFFVEGPCILFQIGLAIFSCLEQRLLACRDQMQVTEVLKAINVPPATLWASACSAEFQLDPEELSQLRNYHKFQKVLQLESNSKSSDMKFLTEHSGCSWKAGVTNRFLTFALCSPERCVGSNLRRFPIDFVQLQHRYNWLHGVQYIVFEAWATY